MIPSRRALGLLCAWLVLGAAASFAGGLVPLWLAAAAVGGALLAADALLVWRSPVPSVVRRVPPAISVGLWTRVHLSIENGGRRGLRLRVFDHLPPRTRSDGLPLVLALPAGTRAEALYSLWPEQRGLHPFGPVELWMRSRLGLWERRGHCPAEQSVRAYPNFRAAAGYELLAAANRTGALGIRRRPRRGEGLEFHQLRDYREGDSLRQIDWKATARLQRAISREYQDERDQQIVFLLDCGRRLHTRDGERSHFDAALDAVLLASHVALRQGDAVGLLTFGGEQRWLAPRKGIGQANALLNSVYDLQSGARSADYTAAARELVLRVRKRGLVVLVSNLRDEDADELAASLRLLSRHHLVLLASLREIALGEALRKPIGGLDDALRVASVRHHLEQRREALRPLAQRGALLLDSEPQGLPIALVNRYLDIKAAGLL